MKRFYSSVLLATAASLLCWASLAGAQVSSETAPQFAGRFNVDLAKGQDSFVAAPLAAQAVGDAYDNTASPAVFGFSSTDLNSTWGDHLLMTMGGLIDQFSFTLFNSGTSLGPVTSCAVHVSFYDGGTTAFLGGFNINANLGSGLTPGFYTILTVTGLGGQGLVLGSDVIVTQSVSNIVGGASRMGIASLDPPTVGSSGPDMYISSTTVGPAGWYTIASGNANPGYRVNIAAATPARTSTWGQLKSLYR
jgi:hypothetical protein